MGIAQEDYWFPWSPIKYERDTLHLSDDADLAYRRLIDKYMMYGGRVPSDPQALAKLVNMTRDQWMAVCEQVLPFFEVSGDWLLHEKCDEVLTDQRERAAERSERAKKAAEARWGNAPSNAHSNATSIPDAMHNDAPGMLGDATRQDITGNDIDVVDASAREEFHSVGEKVLRLAGAWDNPTSRLNYSQVAAWLRAGYDPEADIYPTVERLTAKLGEPPGSLSYYTKAIQQAHHDRVTDVPPFLDRRNQNERSGQDPFLSALQRIDGVAEN